MKPYQELTRLGRVRRMRRLAQAALDAYGLSGARFKFISYSGNTTFRVDVSGYELLKTESERYFPNHCVLRIHEPDYQALEAITSELTWLDALRRDTDLAVPEPLRTLEGELSVDVEVPGVPDRRRCSLLRWIKGRLLTNDMRLRPRHFRAIGRLLAGLHAHSTGWQPPAGFTRPRYDWNGLFGDNDLIKAPASEVWPHIPPHYREPFETVTGQVRQVMEAWGQGTDAFGLIHADIGIGANVLFGGGEARAIDFDDCAFGYWMYDVGVAMSEVYGDEAFPRYRDALREGYEEVRALPGEQWERLDLWVATWHAFEMYWATAGVVRFPDYREGYESWAERAGESMVRCLERGVKDGNI